jgi:hypothetical protein
MIFAFSGQISFMRFFRRVKTTLSNSYTVNHNLHSPFALMRAYAKKTRFVGFCRLSHVLQIAKSSNFAQIIKAVIYFVTVFMVYVPGRWFACHVQPCKPMRKIFFVVNRYRPIAKTCLTSCLFANKIGPSRIAKPHKFAGFWRILQDSFNVVSSNHESELTMKVPS